MNKQEYLSTLYKLLDGLSENDRNDILYDYEEHFRIGMENGKTEEEISESLGDVNANAQQFIADYPMKRAEKSTDADSIFRGAIAAVALAFFNIIFILGPFLGLAGVLIGLFAAAAAMSLSGVAAILASVLYPLFENYINLGGMGIGFIIFASLGITCLGLLLFIGDCYMAKYFYRGTVRYIKWNIEVIKR